MQGLLFGTSISSEAHAEKSLSGPEPIEKRIYNALCIKIDTVRPPQVTAKDPAEEHRFRGIYTCIRRIKRIYNALCIKIDIVRPPQVTAEDPAGEYPASRKEDLELFQILFLNKRIILFFGLPAP